MPKTIIFFSAVVLTIFGLPIVSIAYAGPPGRMNGTSKPLDLGYVPGELLVRFAPKADGRQRTRTERDQIAGSLGAAKVKKDYGIVPGLSHVKLPAGVTVDQAMARLNKRRDIIYAQPNHYLMLTGQKFPDSGKDPDFGKLWGMHNAGQDPPGGTEDADIDAPEAWDIKTDASGVIVAVIDSGVDYTHQDLEDNMWTNPGEQEGDGNSDGYPGVGGEDDDGDGLIDEDSLGNSRFLEDGITQNPSWSNNLIEDDDENGYENDIHGYDFWSEDSEPMDGYGHGTHIAGTIGGVENNDYGVTGVCWNVKIMAVRLFSHDTSLGEEDEAIDAIQYAVAMGAKVISNSWGRYEYHARPYGEPLREAIRGAGDNGVLFVAAANQHNSYIDDVCFYPASYDLDNIVSVMATDKNDDRAWFSSSGYSNCGPVSVDLAAPGTWIWSCYPGNDYGEGEGTSMSTPHVSGACALIRAINPTLTHLEVKGIILSTVDQLQSLNGLCVTEGRLNLGRAAEVAADYAPVFSLKDNVGERVAWFDNVGNLFVRGRLSTGPQEGQEIAGHWKFDDKEDNSNVIDSTEGSNNGTYHGTGGEDDYTSSHHVAGEIDGALEFDGTQDYVSLASAVDALTGNTVTVSAWIKADSGSTGKRAIVSQCNGSALGCILGINIGKPHFYLNSDNSGAEASEAITFDEWHHVAGTYDSATKQVSIYVDGHLEGTGQNDSWVGQNTPAYIAYCCVYPYPYFRGTIDDVRVYNYATGAAEIWDLVFPNSSRFRVCNSSDETVSWFDDCGYGWLKGAIHERQNSLDPESNETADFVVRNSDNDVVGFISDSGDLYLKGSLYEYEE